MAPAGGVAAPGPAPAASGAGAPAPLEVEGLTRSFGGVKAVDDVSLTRAPGELLGIIGANGAGKTTLFDLVSGFVPVEGGRILLGGRDVTRWSPDRRALAGLGRSFQHAELFPAMTVDEALAVAMHRWVEVGDPLSSALHLPTVAASEDHVRRRVHELVELVGLGDCARCSYASCPPARAASSSWPPPVPCGRPSCCSTSPRPASPSVRPRPSPGCSPGSATTSTRP